MAIPELDRTLRELVAAHGAGHVVQWRAGVGRDRTGDAGRFRILQAVLFEQAAGVGMWSVDIERGQRIHALYAFGHVAHGEIKAAKGALRHIGPRAFVVGEPTQAGGAGRRNADSGEVADEVGGRGRLERHAHAGRRSAKPDCADAS